jgi:y4mF family transcriptional regulator
MQANECKLGLASGHKQVYHARVRIKTMEMLGQLVRDQRQRRGWSQSHLAGLAGVSRLWIGHLEQGKESVEMGLVLKTLRALELDLETFPRQTGIPAEPERQP